MRYRLTAPHYLRHGPGRSQWHAADTEVEWGGVPSSAMEPLDDEAKTQIAKYKPRGFDINSIFPAPSLPGAVPPETQLYPHDEAKQRAMRERTAKARAAALAKRQEKAKETA